MRRAWWLYFLSLALPACQALAVSPRPVASPQPAVAAAIRPTMTPSSSLTIVTLGDSLTFGDKDDEPGGGWPRRLLPLIQPARPRARVINLAQPGWTSHDLLQGRDGAPNQIDEAVRVLHEVVGDKIATVWIGVNDLFYLYEFGDPTPAEEAREVAQFKRDLDELLGRLSGTGARIFVALLHDPSQGPVQTSGVFMSTAAEEWTRMSQQAQRYNEVIRAAAVKYNAALVDIPAIGIFSQPALMYEDGIHPSARGYDELAKVWWNALSN